MEYSPTVVATPPRLIGIPHSLTLMNLASRGSWAMMLSSQSSCQPQSQTIKVWPWPARSMPLKKVPLSCAITSAGGRLPQRGHALPLPCDQQVVSFSETVMVKKPPSPGTARQMDSTADARYLHTSGVLVQNAANSPAATTFRCGLVAKKATG